MDVKNELLKAHYDRDGKITEKNIEEIFFKKYDIKDPIAKGFFKLAIDNFSEIQRIYPLNKKLSSELSSKKREYNKLISAHNIELENLKSYYGAVIFYLVGFLCLTYINKIWCFLA